MSSFLRKLRRAAPQRVAPITVEITTHLPWDPPVIRAEPTREERDLSALQAIRHANPEHSIFFHRTPGKPTEFFLVPPSPSYYAQTTEI